ncbi:class F sortase [Streptomyces sp. NPDC002134]|uniref:class F sortase n=2 Tax=unclassified Streptomyces TaxID=2593676 RepID=UPI0036B777E4
MTASPPSLAGAEPTPPVQGSRAGMTALCAVAVLAVGLNLFGGGATPPDASPPPYAPPPVRVSAAPTAPVGSPTGKRLPRSRPVRLLIPKIGVDAPFTDLRIGPSGHLEAPPPNDTNLVGWHVDGASPGEAGTAIIAGHVDTKTSPAVFAGLSELTEGDVFQVKRADGRKASFVVDDTQTFEKDDFPSERVYADTPQAQVRLITCAGDYDRAAKDYTANLVVFGHLL